MAKLPNLTGKEIAKVATKLGFIFDHQTGSHMVFEHQMGEKPQFHIIPGKKSGQDCF